MPQFDREVPTNSESGNDTQYTAPTLTHEEDLTPSTSLLCGEYMLFYDNIVEASMSRQPNFDESNIKDPNIERSRRNIA